MLAENPLALRYILPDDVYVLPNEQHISAVFDTPKEDVNFPAIDSGNAIVTPINAKPEITAAIANEAPAIKTPVGIDADVPEVYQDQPPSFTYLGQNQKNILIMVSYPQHEHMENTHLQALETTLSRIGLTQKDIAILNVSRHTGRLFEQISSYFKPERLLLLGAGSFPQGLPAQPLNQLKQAKGRKLLYTFSFDEMMGDKDKTRAFWEQIKNF